MEDNKIDATETDNSTDSSTKTNETDTTEETSAQDKKEDAKQDVPWHEDPRWKAWQEEKKSLIEFKTKAEPIISQFKPKDEEVNIPAWFGGDEEQWKAYKADQDKLVNEAEERAIKRIESKKADEEKRIKDANDYFEGVCTELGVTTQAEKNKLLKFVMDNELIDSQQRWAYKQGFKFMKAMEPKEDDTNLDARKKIAASTTSESKAEQKPRDYKTANDFKGKNWGSL